MWSKFKTFCGSGMEKKKWHNIQFPFQSHLADWVANWLGCDASGGVGGGLSPFFPYPSIPLSSSSCLSAEWNSSSVARARHMISMRAAEPGCYITGNEWATSLWPDQGRKTHVLLVLVGWLPAERVGNSSSRRDGEMEEDASPSPCVLTVLVLTCTGCWRIVLLSDVAGFLVERGGIMWAVCKSLKMNLRTSLFSSVWLKVGGKECVKVKL